jgi:hypothetical protein
MKGQVMIRVSYLLSAAVLCVWLLGGCRGGQGREAEVARDTTPSAAPGTPPGDVVAIPPDTTRQQPGVRESTPAPPEPGTSVARATPPPDSTPTPKPKPKPNVFPRRKPAPTPKPQVPKPTDTAPAPDPGRATGQQQDTGRPAAQQQDTARAAAQQQDTGRAAQDTATTQALRDPYHRPPRDTVSQQAYDGWKQFNLNCARCHGEDVLGTTIAPHLIASLKPDGPINTQKAFYDVVCHGRPEKGMPAWCPLGLDQEKIDALYSYVKGRSEGKIGPGRPAVRPAG